MTKENEKAAASAAADLAGATIATFLAFGSAYTGIIGAGISGALVIAGSAIAQRNQRRAEHYWQAYVGCVGTLTPEGAVTMSAEELAANPAFQDRVFHGFRSVLEAVDEDVIPNIAFLGAHYEAAGKPVDAFYKCMARFLQDSTTADLATLRQIVEHIVLVGAGGPGAESFAMPHDVALGFVEDTTGNQGARFQVEVAGNGPDVLRRLIDSGLARESPRLGDVVAMVIEPERLKRIKDHCAIPFFVNAPTTGGESA